MTEGENIFIGRVKDKGKGPSFWGSGSYGGQMRRFEDASRKRERSISMQSLAGVLAVATTLALTLTPKGWAMIAPALARG